ncbi:ABC transporter ATP-binding protein [Allohahella marinimesophila]|uniref:ABC transporter ATP-binding protein n=1 Tax=Allohahella marinimesophila TaxID=1054972 RepID=A0ABP7NRU5_9GAMM
MAVPAVSCHQVSKVWNPDSASPLLALDDLSFEVERGEFIVLLGPSGCGKSTLLYMIAGLESTSSGTIECDKLPVTGPDSDRGMIFQEASLYPWLTLSDNVTFGLGLRGMGPGLRREAASKIMKKVGLGDMLDKRPDELSGGMRQRVAVARALAMQPKVLMMDEPFAALDVQTRTKMQDFLLQIWRDSGASIILVTHSIDEAISLADRIIVFTSRPGRVKKDIRVDLERPRSPRDPAFHALQDELSELLADEVDRAFADQQRSETGSHTA